MKKRKPCALDGCDKPAFAEQRCWPHLRDERLRRGDLCSVDGCDRPRQGQSMCATHGSAASRRRVGRHDTRHPRECAWCRRHFTTTTPATRYCSQACWQAVKRQPLLPVVHPNPAAVSHLPLKHPARRPPRPRSTWWTILVYGPCGRCGEPFMSTAASFEQRSLYCSRSCARSQGKDRRRAAKREGFVADVHRRRIFERDGWRCQICRKRVLRRKAVPHPRAPTIDHIIPLALGGTHEPSNCQLACFMCNCRKSSTGTGDQLRLIG